MDEHGCPTAAECDDEHSKRFSALKEYLPFLQTIIDNAKELDIQDAHLEKLRALYDMVDKKKLPAAKLKSCQSVVDNLYNKYHEGISSLAKNKSKKLVLLKEDENQTKSLEVGMSTNTSDKTLNNSELEHPIKNSPTSSFSSQTLNDNLDNLEHGGKENAESVYGIFLENNKCDKTSRSIDSNNCDVMLTKDDPSGFSDSRIRLNKFIGKAANSVIEKLDTTDTSRKVSESTIKELAKQVYDGLVKQKTADNFLKSVDLEPVNLNTVKQALIDLQKPSTSKPIQPPPLPPVELMCLEAKQIQSIPTVDSVSECASHDNVTLKPSQQQNISIPLSNKSSSIRHKLNDDINVVHKIGASNEPKQKFISALKPGTLIDLESTETTRTSLHIESYRPVTKPYDKCTDNKLSISNISVPRDPRIRNKTLNPEFSNLNSIQQSMQNNVQRLIPVSPICETQSSIGSTNVPSLLALNMGHVKPTSFHCSSFEHKPQDTTPNLHPVCIPSQLDVQHGVFSGHGGSTNFQSAPGLTNLQSFNKTFSSEYDKNSIHIQSTNYKMPTQTQSIDILTQRNDFYQYSGKTHPSSVQHDSNVRYREPGPISYNQHNDSKSPRDPRSKANDRGQFRNYKEYREAKYGKEKNTNQGFARNHNREHDSNRSFNRDNERFKHLDKTKITKSPYNTFGAVTDRVNINNFKIPKIKRNEDVVVVTNINDKNLSPEKNPKSETKSLESVPKELSPNDESNVNQNEINNVESKCSSSEEPTLQVVKPKKPKKYSKEKEFEIIVKQAVESLSNDETYGPRTRTRSTLKKKEETFKKVDLKDTINENDKTDSVLEASSKQTYIKPNQSNLKEVEDISKNVELKSSNKLNLSLDKEKYKTNLNVNECSTKISTKLNENSVNNSELFETDHNVISSTSKEPLEVESVAQDVCKNQKEIVSSNEINSTAEATSNPVINERLISLLANPTFMSVINKLDEHNIDKLNKLMESSEVLNLNENKTMSDRERTDTDEQKKSKKKLKKEKKKKRKMKKSYGEGSSKEESNNEHVNCVSEDDNFDEELDVKKVRNHSNDDESISSRDSCKSGTNKSKPSKRLTYNERRYGCFEILKKNSVKTELKELKIVISKFDKTVKKSESINNELSNDIQVSNKNNKKLQQNLKPKKPFLGPLSVKLARQKSELSSNNDTVQETHTGFNITNESDNKKNVKNSKILKNESVSSTTNNLVKECKVINSCQSTSIESTVFPLESKGKLTLAKVSKVNQDLNEIIPTASNVPEIRSDLKKSRPKMTELDKLHADISEMYDCDALLNAPNIRHCRTNKQIDYVNTNNVFSKQNKVSNVEQTELNEKQSDRFVHKVGKPKATKKNKKLTSKMNTGINKIHALQPKKCIKLKPKVYNKKKKCKQSKKVSKNINLCKESELDFGSNKEESQLDIVSNQEESQLVIVSNKEESRLDIVSNKESEIIPRILSKIDFKDINYFQTAEGNSLNCKFCDYNDTGLNIVRHYKNKHHNEEVLPSRLSSHLVSLLVSESLKENYGTKSSEDYVVSKVSNSGKNIIYLNFNCVFCQMSVYDAVEFYDHISAHTGEYRYKCKMCEHVYVTKNELEAHILEHPGYDKTGGISSLLYPDPIQSCILFGYLCSLCNYVQLNYDNMVKHMKKWHEDEDLKFNGYWTIVRINMSFIEDPNNKKAIISYNNLSGCLPPLQYQLHDKQTIPKNNDNVQKLKSSVSDLVQVQNSSLVDPKFIKKEASIENLNMPSVSSLPQPINSPSKNQSTTSVNEPETEYYDYTLKESLSTCEAGGLSCRLVNSMLVYKCSVSKCLQNPYSTILLEDFSKHIELSHLYIVWDGMCQTCKHKIEKTNEQFLLKDALQHLISHHLDLKNKQPATSNILDLEKEQSLSIKCPDADVSTNEKSQASIPLRVRRLSGDNLSNRDASMTTEEEKLKSKNGCLFVLKNDEKKGTIGSIECEKISDMCLFKCIEESCPNEFSTFIFEELVEHIKLNHKITAWDGMCKICGFRLWRHFSQLFLENALEHLKSYHLVEYQKKLTMAPKESVQNQNIFNADRSLADNPSDNENSSHKNAIVENEKTGKDDLCENSTQSNTIVLCNPSEISVYPIDINQIFNGSLTPVMDAKHLKKKNARKINSSDAKTNESQLSKNDDLRKLKEIQTLCEVVISNPHIYLEPGQHTINNGEPIQGTYCLIDTEYRKCYAKKIKELPMISMKTRLAFDEMMSLPNSLILYKCLDRPCTKMFSDKERFKLHMKLHFSNIDKKKKISCHAEQFKKCTYCLKVFNDENSLADHIADTYTSCMYFCTQCFYRAYTESHVLVHELLIHNISKPIILKLKHDENVENPKEILKAVDFNDFVLPYVCGNGSCHFSCYLQSDFLSHLNQEHQQCDMFCCYICAGQDVGNGFFGLKPKPLIEHFTLHNINIYQCIFCLFGTEVIDLMIGHLAMEHFEYEPLCLERSPKSNFSDTKRIENLKILRLKKVVDNKSVRIVNSSKICPETSHKSKKRRLESHDVISTAMKSANIDANTQSSDTIVITVPDKAYMESGTSLTPAFDNEFIMLDDEDNNRSNLEETLKINDSWTTTNNSEKEPQLSNTDVIVIDDDDDDDIVPDHNALKKRKNIVTTKRLAYPIVALDEVFACKDLGKTFLNGNAYKKHLVQCTFCNQNGQLQCAHCTKKFKTPFNMTEHIKLHGPNRFKCSICYFNLPSHRAIEHHMKDKHDITNLDYVPSDANLTDNEKDEFIVFEDKTLSLKKYNTCFTCAECPFICNTRKVVVLHMINEHNIQEYELSAINPPKNLNYNQEYQIKRFTAVVSEPEKEQHTPSKRKRSIDNSNFVGNKRKEIVKTKNIIQEPKYQLFSPDTIESVPKSHIFSESVGCSLCTYNTKVRSNLIIHLNGHKKGQDNTTKEIVNPVPSIGKSELHFDKSFNLSASSFEAMNFEKNKTEEINKKIVEVPHPDNLNLELYPKFIPLNKRFNCLSPCTHNFMCEEMLTKHLSIIHSDYQYYVCPHCPSNSVTGKIVLLNKIGFHLMHHSENLYKCQYCVYIHFNRDEMKAHMRNVHLLELTTHSQSNIIVIRQTLIKDHPNGVRSTKPEWICNMCTSNAVYTENDIKTHIKLVHNVSNMFKCPMCVFEHNDDNTIVFEHHFKFNHPSVAVKLTKVFDKISDIKQLSVNKPILGIEYTQELQALESITPTLMPPACRGIPVEPIPYCKASNKSRSVSKSPAKLAAKSSTHQSRKPKMLLDNFNKNDSFGTISSNGYFVCPRCNDFETIDVEFFSEHLKKDINYKTWKCIECFEISDSPKKMAWHVKKHGSGSKYEKIEDKEKLLWVQQAVEYQTSLLNEFKKKNQEKHAIEGKQYEFVTLGNTSLDFPPKNIIKIKDGECENKVTNSQTNYQISDEIINLDDSDSE